jgi:hypothetical protein
VSCDATHFDRIAQCAEKLGIQVATLGHVTDADVIVNNENWGNISSWKNDYDTAIEKKLA